MEAASRSPAFRPIPPDFADRAPGMSSTELQAYYRASDKTVARWRREAGIRSPHRVGGPPDGFRDLAGSKTTGQLAAQYHVSIPTIRRWCVELGIKPKPQSWGFSGRTTPPADLRDDSPAGRAQRFLQRFAPAYRCKADGQPDPRGGFYRVGRVVLTPDELIARAERKGFSLWQLAA